jgi:hypothetical protein
LGWAILCWLGWQLAWFTEIDPFANVLKTTPSSDALDFSGERFCRGLFARRAIAVRQDRFFSMSASLKRS